MNPFAIILPPPWLWYCLSKGHVDQPAAESSAVPNLVSAGTWILPATHKIMTE